MKYVGSVLLSFLFSALAFGQAIVGPTSITSSDGGHSQVPRFAVVGGYANNLIVPTGTTMTLPAVFDFDVIEVSGTLKLSRTYDTSGKFIIIQVLPGGSLDFGTVADPVLRKADLVVKDTPLLTGTDGALGPDPEQFGNGIHIFGEWKAYGRKLDKTWTTFSPAAAGATSLTLTDAAINWQIGDSLLLPDTRQPAYYNPVVFPTTRIIRREETVRITAINGNTVSLSKPLDFEHEDIRDSDGNLLTLPFVANCTRNIVLSSENPSGVRGHCMFMDMAHVNVYYTSFVGLGRTLPKTLDSFNSHTMHVGTNQIARYGVHWHHVHGHADEDSLTGRLVGCYLDGGDISKWSVVQHGTADLLISDNVSERAAGAGFTSAEDGYEIRGQYIRNLAAYVLKGNGDSGKNNVAFHNPGGEGSGIWGHGSGSTFSGNVTINCNTGYSFVHMEQAMGHLVPGIPGGPEDTAYDPKSGVPVSFDNNLAVACMIGLEGWRIPPKWDMQAFKILNSGSLGVMVGGDEPGNVLMHDSAIVNTFLEYLGTTGIESSQAYTTSVELHNTTVEGYTTGLVDAREYMTVQGGKLKNRDYNIDWSRGKHLYTPGLIDSVIFEKILGTTIDLMIGNGGPTNSDNPVPDPINSPVNFDTLFTIINWKGDGKKYHVYENFDAPANSINLDGLLNAKAIEDGSIIIPQPPTPPPSINNPPVVSAISAFPTDVDPAKSGVQEYESTTVTYSALASDPDAGDTLSWVWSFVYNGTETVQSQGNGPVQQVNFAYPVGARTYLWRLKVTDNKGASATSELTVQVISKPVPPPSTLRILWDDGRTYTYQLQP